MKINALFLLPAICLVTMLTSYKTKAQNCFGDITSYNDSSLAKSYLNAVAATDLNNDHYLDLVVANETSQLSLFMNNGDGSFDSSVYTIVSTPSNTMYNAVKGADFNKDGYNDIVAGGIDGYFIVLYNDQHGSFTEYAPAPCTDCIDQIKDIVIADFNNDTYPDCAAAIDFLPGAAVLLNNKDGSFTQNDYHDTSDLALTNLALTSSITTGDYNKDGYADLAMVNFYSDSSSTSVMINKGDGTFKDPMYCHGGASLYGICSADFNQDGYDDIASVGNSVYIFINKKDGTFNNLVYYYGGSYNLYYAKAADIDKDGYPDLVYTDGSNLFILFNKQDGTFGTPYAYSISESWYPVIADLNNDQQLDLAVTGSELYVLLGKTVKLNFSGTVPLCNGQSLTLASSTADNYLWNTSSIQQDIPVYTPGMYKVTAHYGTCVSSDSVEVVDCATTSIAAADQETALTIYPQPASQNLFIQLPNAGEVLNITLMDVSGQPLLKTTSSESLTPMDISSIAAGTYIIKVQSNGTTVQKKIVKQ